MSWLILAGIALLVGLGLYVSAKTGIKTAKVLDKIKQWQESADKEVTDATKEADKKRKEAENARETDPATVTLDKFDHRFGG
jgi:hypothetical protein